MYCKNCGKIYPADKKVCNKCGLALIKGKPHTENKNMKKRIIILSVCAAVLIIALFLTVEIPRIAVAPIKGMWYEEQGMLGTVEFKDGGKAERKTYGITTEYNYTFDGHKGKITAQGENYDFTYNGKTIVIQDATYVKNVVEPFDPKASSSS